MAHTMDALEEWELIQASINQNYFSLDPINHTNPAEEQLNTTTDNSSLPGHYRVPEQLRHNSLSLTDSEHESHETEEDAIVPDQESNSVGEEATGKNKPWPVIWWKSQLENLFKHLSVVGMGSCKPFWCMPVVAAMVSFVVLKKKIFGTKHKQRTGTTSIKKEIQFAASTVQLNQTLSVVRRIPVIKILPPTVDANQWAIVNVK